MPNLQSSLTGSGSCRHVEAPEARLEWRPSRLLAVALLALTVLAVVSLLASEAPRWLIWAGSLAVVAHGIWLLRRERSRPRHDLCFKAGDVVVDGTPVAHARVRWRGPLVLLYWQTGDRWHSLAWWPDTLPSARRRELRLAAPAEDTGRAGGSVAP